MLELTIAVLSGLLIIGVAVEVFHIVLADQADRDERRADRACRRELERRR